MKAALALLLMSATPAFAAGECYQNEEDPTWTVTVNGFQSTPEMIWNRGGETVELNTVSAGTGIDRRYVIDDEGNRYGFVFVDDDLVFELGVYRLGCAK